MKLIFTLAAGIGLAALAACSPAAEENVAANVDANAMMPADNLTVDANNVTVIDNGTDMNMGNMDMDMNAGNAADTTAANTTGNGY